VELASQISGPQADLNEAALRQTLARKLSRWYIIWQGNCKCREADQQPSGNTNALSSCRFLIKYPIGNCPAKSPVAASFKSLYRKRSGAHHPTAPAALLAGSFPIQH
jgi:hypothetical protein